VSVVVGKCCFFLLEKKKISAFWGFIWVLVGGGVRGQTAPLLRRPHPHNPENAEKRGGARYLGQRGKKVHIN